MEWLFRLALGLLADLVAPMRCAACDAACPRTTAFCRPCALTLVRAAPEDPQRLAAFVYGGAIAEALKRFKFNDRPDLAPALVAGLEGHLARLRGAVDLVVPVPLHPSRLVERGYNQAALLAALVARRLGVTSAPMALRRLVATARQTELNRAARAANVASAFAVEEAREIAGRQVLLIDDVETTGATLAACKAALLSGGAKGVVRLVVARALESS